MAVNGKAILEWDLRALERELESGPDGRTFTLTVDRNGSSRILTVKAKELLR